jgi:UDP-glucose 4-epimerase
VVAIYSDFAKARHNLGWMPEYGVDEIMQTAWNWELKRSGR